MQESQAVLLYQLQAIDLTLAKRRARLKEIEGILGQDESVTQARSQLEAAEKTLKPAQIRARDLDLEIKSIVQKIQTTDSSLYSGKIRNPKELQEMQDEVASLKRRQSQLEDELLEAMVQSESGQAAVVEAQKTLNDAQARWAGSQVDLLDEKQRLEGEVITVTAQRKQAAEVIDKAGLTTYETLRKTKNGKPIALLQGNSCMTCGVEQTSALAQQVRQAKTLIYCGSCGRILATHQ
ncbi:MAG: hypothetical protein ABI947_17270 [Chloroflexota bacterium]